MKDVGPHQCAADSHNRVDAAGYVRYFAGGRVVGPARVQGEMAEVDFDFDMSTGHPRRETMNLVQRVGRWYLSSF